MKTERSIEPTVAQAAPASGRPGRWTRWSSVSRLPRPVRRWGLMLGVLVVVCFVGPFFARYNPNAGVAMPLEAPSGAHLLGTDADGRDVLSRLLLGSRISLVIALLSVALGALIGTTMGLLAAVTEGRFVSVLLVRFMDAILAFPFVVLAAVTAGVTFGQTVGLGPVQFGEKTILAGVLALIQVPIFGRLTRATAMDENSKDYVVAARACGLRPVRILRTELFPNVLPALVVQTSFSIVIAISAEAAISYLGLGIQKPSPSWGNMIRDGLDSIVLGAWWIPAFPTLIVLVVSVVLTGLGEALRHALDPRAQQRRVSAIAKKEA
ncbi:ABC transporter permease [Dactylosporangium sp. NPDC050688]|uniref:ABC transporter permease n=1 Tax=Dactylosporangium sp. NPDC050688 TaxID=3157217 RepID=UPI00340C8AFD